MSTAGQSTDIYLEELKAEKHRRGSVLRALAVLLSGLTLIAILTTAPMNPPLLAFVGYASCLVGSAIAFILSRNRVDVAAGVFIAGLLLQYLTTAGALEEIEVAGMVLMYNAVVPLIATVITGLRGTILATVLSIVFCMGGALVWVARVGLEQAASPMTTAAFFPMFTGTLAIVVAATNTKEFGRRIDQLRRQREVEARFEWVADRVSDLIALLDHQGRFEFASASYGPVMGRDPKALIGTVTPEMVHPDDLEKATQSFVKALESGFSDTVIRMKVRDGEYRAFHTRHARTGEDPPKIALASRDVTSIRAEQQAADAHLRMEALTRLTRGIAHDYNNLLSVIGTSAELLAADGKPDQQLHVTAIADAVQRGASMTQRLLTFARNRTLANEHSVIGPVVRELVPLIRQVVGDAIQVRFVDESDDWAVHLAASEIEQILLNLAHNSRDAIDDRGALEIRLAAMTLKGVDGLESGDYVRLVVEDDGPGIPDPVRDRIFEPFFTTKQTGTGLGLSTVIGLAAQNGGRVQLEDVTPRGSRFVIDLPRHRLDSVPSRAIPEPAPSQRCLIIDDQPAVANALAELLRHSGYEVHVAHDPTSAREKFASHPPATALVDVNLGPDNGIELASTLMRENTALRCLLISGLPPEEGALQQLDPARCRFVQKPINRARIESALASFE